MVGNVFKKGRYTLTGALEGGWAMVRWLRRYWGARTVATNQLAACTLWTGRVYVSWWHLCKMMTSVQGTTSTKGRQMEREQVHGFGLGIVDNSDSLKICV
jgi:hypothetical protein